jgi:hypothetical protein
MDIRSSHLQPNYTYINENQSGSKQNDALTTIQWQHIFKLYLPSPELCRFSWFPGINLGFNIVISKVSPSEKFMTYFMLYY